MKIILIYILLLSPTVFLDAQTVKYLLSDEMTVKRENLNLFQLHVVDDGAVYLQENDFPAVVPSKGGEQGLKLRKYDKNLKLLYEIQYENEFKGKDLHRFYTFKKRLFVIGKSYNKGEGVMQIDMAEIDTQTGKFKKDWVKLLSAPMKKKDWYHPTDITLTNDSGHMAVFVYALQETNILVKIAAIDESLNIKATNEFNTNAVPPYFEIRGILADVNANTLLIVEKYTEVKIKNRSYKPDFNGTSLSKYSKSGKKEFEFFIQSKEKLPLERSYFKLVGTNDFIVGGFFGAYRDTNKLKGIAVKRINFQTGSIISESELYIRDVIPAAKRYLANEKGSRFSNLLNKFFTRKIVEINSGEFLLIAEGFYNGQLPTNFKLNAATVRPQIEKAMNMNTNTFSTYVFTSGDLLFIRVDTNGQLLPLTVFPKEQVYDSHSSTGDDYFNSFQGVVSNNSVVCFFNDEQKNAQKVDYADDIKPMSNKSKISGFVLKMDITNGKFYREKVIDYKENIALYKTSVRDQNSLYFILGNVEQSVFNRNKLNIQLGRISLN
jgi:hypothetical protein